MWPVYLFFAPETAQSILQYRVDRMAGAAGNAQRNGFDGLMYPWESAFSGTEVCQSGGLCFFFLYNYLFFYRC